MEKMETVLCGGFHRQKQPDAVIRYINAKVLSNMRICESWESDSYNHLYDFPFVMINGKEYPNLSYYSEMLSEKYLLQVFGEDRISEAHGDLTVENIICRQGQAWYLIDPNVENIHGTIFLDYAKLLQSFHGNYEFLKLVRSIKVTENRIDFLFTGSAAYKELYEKFRCYLYDHFTEREVMSIYFHEAVHWLRLMKYQIKKDAKRAVVFYAGMLMVLADIKEMFGDGTDETKEQTCNF